MRQMPSERPQAQTQATKHQAHAGAEAEVLQKKVADKLKKNPTDGFKK